VVVRFAFANLRTTAKASIKSTRQ